MVVVEEYERELKMKGICIGVFCYLIGFSVYADLIHKPSGELVLQSLLSAGAISLADEPLCNLSSVSMNKPNLLLRDHLATMLSTSFESNNQTVVATACNESKHDLPNGQVMNVWDCSLGIRENGLAGEFISSSTVVFSLGVDDYSLIRGSLRCF